MTHSPPKEKLHYCGTYPEYCESCSTSNFIGSGAKPIKFSPEPKEWEERLTKIVTDHYFPDDEWYDTENAVKDLQSFIAEVACKEYERGEANGYANATKDWPERKTESCTAGTSENKYANENLEKRIADLEKRMVKVEKTRKLI